MSKRHRKERGVTTNTHVWRVLILLLAYAVRAVSLDAQGLWRDEVDQWRFALQPWGEMVRNFTRAGWNGPLFSPLLRLWIGLTGDSVYAMRYFSLLWGVVSVALIYVLAKRLVNRRTAVWSALLMALSPYMVWYAQEIKMYTWVPMLALLALYALDRASTCPRWSWWLAALVATSVAFYSHILAALLIPVEVVWFWLHPRRHRGAWRGGLAVLLLLTLPYLPLLGWQMDLLGQQRETGFPDYALGEMLLMLFNGWTGGVYQGNAFGDSLARYVAFFLGTMALLGGGWLALQRRWRALAMVAGWLMAPLVAIWLISMRGPIFTDRYLIWTAPAFYLLAGVGLAVLCSFRRWSLVLLVIHVVGLNGIGLYKQAVHPLKPQFEAATRYIEAHRESDALVLFQIPYNYHVASYYAESSLTPWGEAPYTNWQLPDGSYEIGENYVDGEMAVLTLGHDGVWLVYSEVQLWDDRELVKAWLDGHGRLIDVQDFVGVTLFNYTLGAVE